KDVLLFNETTTEVFAYTGVTNALFQNKGIVIERGCAATHSVINLDNTAFWLGDNGSGYRLEGYTEKRWTTYPMEQAIAQCHLSGAFAFDWVDRGHSVYYLTFPDGHTWGY